MAGPETIDLYRFERILGHAGFLWGIAGIYQGCIALALQSRAQLLIAPAMNGKMWQHPATQANVAVLSERGAIIIGPGEGELACGYEGLGRLREIEAISNRA